MLAMVGESRLGRTTGLSRPRLPWLYLEVFSIITDTTVLALTILHPRPSISFLNTPEHSQEKSLMFPKNLYQDQGDTKRGSNQTPRLRYGMTKSILPSRAFKAHPLLLSQPPPRCHLTTVHPDTYISVSPIPKVQTQD